MLHNEEVSGREEHIGHGSDNLRDTSTGMGRQGIFADVTAPARGHGLSDRGHVGEHGGANVGGRGDDNVRSSAPRGGIFAETSSAHGQDSENSSRGGNDLGGHRDHVSGGTGTDTRGDEIFADTTAPTRGYSRGSYGHENLGGDDGRGTGKHGAGTGTGRGGVFADGPATTHNGGRVTAAGSGPNIFADVRQAPMGQADGVNTGNFGGGSMGQATEATEQEAGQYPRRE